ncbi:Dna2/Cas4 domain-containing protein [Clostridium tetani]|nr:Dna2/Cas4 domain-containing protein [Clostridium tetani]
MSKNIENLLTQENPPEVINESKCKKCAYFEYCYI